MKKILLIVIIVFTTFQSQAQKSKEKNDTLLKSCNFIEKSPYNIIWQKTYEVDMTASEITKNIKDVMFFSEIVTETDNSIVGKFENIEPMWKESGFKFSAYGAFFATKVSLSGKLIVEVKDNRYRVTITDITIVSSITNSIYNKPTNPFPYITNKKGVIKKDNISSIKIYNYTFNKKFTLIKKKVNDKW